MILTGTYCLVSHTPTSCIVVAMSRTNSDQEENVGTSILGDPHEVLEDDISFMQCVLVVAHHFFIEGTWIQPVTLVEYMQKTKNSS